MPKTYRVTLTGEERKELESLLARGKADVHAASPIRTRSHARLRAGRRNAMPAPPGSCGSSQPKTPASNSAVSTPHFRPDTALAGC